MSAILNLDGATAQLLADIQSIWNAHEGLVMNGLAAVIGVIDGYQSRLINLDNRLVALNTLANVLLQESAELDAQAAPVNQIVDQYRCPICTITIKTVIFQCGHGFCHDCVKKRKSGATCPVCRQKVIHVINLKENNDIRDQEC